MCWCFLCWLVSSSRKYSGVLSFYSLFFMVGLLQAMHMRAEPSLIFTLPCACVLSSLQDEVRTLSSGWAHSWLLCKLSWLVPVVSAPSKIRCGHSLVGAHTPRSLGTLPVAEHTPPVGACSLSSLRVEVRTLLGQLAQSLDGWRGGEETGAVAAGNSPQCP